MPTYSYYCRECSESYKIQMSMEEQETRALRCPNCGAEERQELYSISSDGGKGSCGGCCGGAHGCQ